MKLKLLGKTIDAKKLLSDNWNKCPSVTTGGKTYFYTKRINDRMNWIIWNRQLQTYEYIGE